jgi:hypothetical protein
MDDVASLLERAGWYRSLAARADEHTSADLLYLAEQYEALARDMEQQSNDQ